VELNAKHLAPDDQLMSFYVDSDRMPLPWCAAEITIVVGTPYGKSEISREVT
jgi:hypothetical protein